MTDEPKEFNWRDQEEAWRWGSAICSLCGEWNNWVPGYIGGNEALKNHIQCRMSNPLGDIFKAVKEQRESHGETKGILIEGDDAFVMYE